MSKFTLPIFSSRSFIVSSLKFKSLIHLEFIFVNDVRKQSGLTLLHITVQSSQHHLLRRLFFLHCTSNILPPLALFIISHINMGLYSLPLIYVSVLGPASYCFDCCSFVVQFETKGNVTSSCLLLSQDCFGYLWYFVFPYKFKNFICSSSVKNAIGILIRPTPNLQIALGNIVILIILILLIHEHSYLPICLCCLQFISSVSYSFLVQVFYLFGQIYSQVFHYF